MGLDFSGLPRLWDVKGWLRAILSREPHPLLQFIRYGIAGVGGMAANPCPTPGLRCRCRRVWGIWGAG
jgi:hypothetical protein